MVELIAEHLIETDLIFEGARVLDLGCRNFEWTKAMRAKGCIVFPVDCDVLNEGQAYYRVAITNYDGKCGVNHTKDPQGTHIQDGNEIDCFTLQSFSKMVGVKKWECIKLDVEGEEEKIIYSMTSAPSKSLSIEFHCHLGQTPAQIEAMVQHLESLGYERTRHEATNQHGAGLNFWSSLFIKK